MLSVRCNYASIVEHNLSVVRKKTLMAPHHFEKAEDIVWQPFESTEFSGLKKKKNYRELKLFSHSQSNLMI